MSQGQILHKIQVAREKKNQHTCTRGRVPLTCRCHMSQSCCCNISLLHVADKCPYYMSLQHVPVTCRCYMSPLHVSTTCFCCMFPYVLLLYVTIMYSCYMYNLLYQYLVDNKTHNRSDWFRPYTNYTVIIFVSLLVKKQPMFF